MAYVKREANDGSVAWTNTVTAVTAYRTDLASGVTAAEVAYTDAQVTQSFSGALSTINPTSTLYQPTTASA
jgi:hypothetical protein